LILIGNASNRTMVEQSLSPVIYET